ncbi:hypothetical protein WJR50_30045 [Catalinimonas sp. 4WD22]|uniref:hypothetical protein n=1 Tax=Catalinimonas locisalis TaxID=3133978 RepID=UPI0031016803
MDLKDISSISIKDKVKLLKERGNYLATRTLEDYYIRLYTFKGIYFEIWSSSHLPWDAIAKVKMLDSFKQLECYLPSDFFARNNRYHPNLNRQIDI